MKNIAMFIDKSLDFEFRALIPTSLSPSNQIKRYMSPRQLAKHHFVGGVQLFLTIRISER